MSTVILVHGLWVNGWDMSLLNWRLRRDGYKVLRFAYPSVRFDLSQNAQRLHRFLLRFDCQSPHIVAHSLGGLLVRQTLDEYPETKLGRIVTLATPHRGSISAQGVSKLPFGKILLGKSVQQGLLSTTLPWNPTYEFGSIAGTRSLGLGRLFCELPVPNDGTVAVEETYLEGMRDHIELPVNHMGMLSNALVAKNVVHFLEQGCFLRPGTDSG